MTGRTIGKLAQEAGVHVETVRYYERIGLLRQPEKPSQGWRTYTDKTLRRIKFIKSAQGLGFTLEEIQLLLDAQFGEPPRDCRNVHELAEVKLDEIATRMEHLREIHEILSGILEQCPVGITEVPEDVLAPEKCPLIQYIAMADTTLDEASEEA
ncbi:MAG: MerR family transcriptional regulator [Bradymonadaceae bacterium]